MKTKPTYPVLSQKPASFDKPLAIVTAAQLELEYQRVDAQIAGHRASLGKPLSLRVITYTRENGLVLWEQWHSEMLKDRYAGQTRHQRRRTEKQNRQQRRAEARLAREQKALFQKALFDCPMPRPTGLFETIGYTLMTALSSDWFALGIIVVLVVVVLGGHVFPEIHEYLTAAADYVTSHLNYVTSHLNLDSYWKGFPQ